MAHPNAFRFEQYPNAVRFKPVVTGNVQAIADRFQINFCDDYLAFLAVHNGYNFDSIADAPRCEERLHIIDYLRYLYGIDTGWEHNDLGSILDSGVIEPPYRRFAYPVGEGPGGNLIVQIQEGSLRGQIMLIDHEVHIEPDEFENTYGRKIESYTADKLLPWLRDKLGSFVPVGGSLAEFLEDLLIMREDNGAVNIAIVSHHTKDSTL